MFLSKFPNPLLLLLPILCFCVDELYAETNTITSTSSITDPHALVSPGRLFRLGFFSPENTAHRYLAVYYNISEGPVIWVANRETPLSDTSGSVSISVDGNLVLTNGRNETLWSTNATSAYTANTTAELLDTGNLVLRQHPTGKVIWDSLSHPTDSMVPIQRMNEQPTRLTSWRSNSDPGIGNFTVVVEGAQMVTRNNGRRYYRTGLWNGVVLMGIEDMYSPHGIVDIQNRCNSSYSKLDLDYTGSLRMSYLSDRDWTWHDFWAVPKYECDLYEKCGPNGFCNSLDSPICSCLRGFQPANKDEWGRGNWTSGCVRRTELKCDADDGFLRMSNIKVPDFPQQVKRWAEDECQVECLRNCACLAYSFDSNNIGCMFWTERLVDIQQFDGVGPVMYLRLAASELQDKTNGTRLVVIIVPLVVGLVFLSLCIFIAWWCVSIRKGNKIQDQKTLEIFEPHSRAIGLQDESEKGDFQMLPVFTFKSLADATNQFHDENMLGMGGFGYVYKGRLANGEDIAVKRLSTNSNQGVEEFKNEAVVISKVQHRNLVKVLGCCAEGEEKMLVYEYMPNRSLDLCLFDMAHPSQKLLDWKKRFSIIEGVGRGLLYLHRDSRLKIIHRDLKPSNVLLDKDWEPKISDFGMARIFGCNQDQAKTTRVVGTYGYMAPEYAMDGLFSEKSDVYSFGILMLEIVSGKKNTQYYNKEWSLNLLGWAWKLWKEDNGMALADQGIISNLNFEAEIVRCIHIALLCVQEFSKYRPTFQTVMSMLSLEIVDLPLPEQPLFEENWDRVELAKPTSQCRFSINKLTITEPCGR